MRVGSLAGGTDRQIGCNPFSGCVYQQGRSRICAWSIAVAIANDIEPAGERSIAEGPVALAREWRADRRNQGFLGVSLIGLGLGQRRSDRPDCFTGAVHVRPRSGRS